MADNPTPMVGIVVVNYFGGDMTLECLASLDVVSWPGDRLAVALVDNGSEPGFVDGVRLAHPAVRIVETGSNLGFGGACNRGFDALTDCDYIALLNNDAIPEPDWLEPLVAALEADPGLGAATPKVLLADGAVTLTIRSTARSPGGGDGRSLGVQLCGARIDGLDVSGRVQLLSGCWGWEHDDVTVGGGFTWTDGLGKVAVPAGRESAVVDLLLASGLGPVATEIEGGGVAAAFDVGRHPTWHRIGDVAGHPVINNAGTVLGSDGSVADRGEGEADAGNFDERTEVFGWSGAAVLLRRAFLDDVGVFDSRYFLYYEDADLSWRGRLRGWSYLYEPDAVVHHRHSATIGTRSELTRHITGRNRLVMIMKCGPPNLVRQELRRRLARFVSIAAQDVVARAVRGRPPVHEHVVAEARVIASLVRLAPHALGERRKIAKGARLPLDQVTKRWST